MFAHNGYWLHPANCQLFSVHVKLKIFGATAKKISRRFLRIYRPQSEHFRFVIHRRDRFYRIEIRERISVAQRFILISEVKRYGTLIEELIGLVGETF
ncbi:DUF1661 domain-containing protein [Porphyromonas gingivalis]|uniref:DUF1661 domain-containing protein n=1 Tax=Porphyromonas gingivalis TaxID=837 RepID=UPI001F274913|nr:DUF1661 domain-containing protein [Porphyromonas gingivalis]MCE8173851.1 DUF1661 domain-containing protein [Porphyromonas gingivalis]